MKGLVSPGERFIVRYLRDLADDLESGNGLEVDAIALYVKDGGDIAHAEPAHAFFCQSDKGRASRRELLDGLMMMANMPSQTAMDCDG